jgi:hypothetical protein
VKRSPLLFVIMVNGVPKTIRHSYSGMYADDKIIWDQNQNLPIPPKEIGVNASRVLEVVCKVGFEIIAQQNHINCLLPKKSTRKDVLKIGGAEVTVQTDAKILGVNFDRKVSWKKHMEEVELSCNKSIYNLRTLSGTKWGQSKSDERILWSHPLKI